SSHHIRRHVQEPVLP
nr:immunoglobulin heavy chain junction region [Homo sapiens]